ncbi:MAG: SurA N-terminal domain-containing protein [Hyphomicrobiales bacterium]|nr:SurA N-terminal domain-containing protein [Hyphomicrobiales bacterium]
MLDGMRAASQNWVGRLLMAVVMGVIVVSFAIWGVGDIFRGFRQDQLGTVGSTEISANAFRFAYQNALQRVQQQAGRVVTNDEARIMGLDRQTLGKMVAEAALDQKAKQLGLAISDTAVAQTIANDPTFQDAGKFDKLRFDALLRENGYNERSFVAVQRAVYLRQELADAVAAKAEPPVAMIEAIERYRTQTRAIDYVVLSPAAAGTVADPDAAALKAYYEANKSAFRAPEYRKLVYLSVNPADLAKPDLVSDADAQKLYDEVKEKRFGSPEKREVQQIVFPDEAAAKAAADRIAAGATFDAIAAERKLSPKDFDLGLVTRDAIADPEARAAIFAGAQGALVGPIKGAFGYTIARTTKIVPASVKPFADVSAELKKELALKNATQAVKVLHDKIEDARAAGKNLTDAARAAGLEARSVEAVDARGRGKDGAKIALPSESDLLKAAYASDIGVDNDTVATRDNGYVWFEVARIDPAHDLSFDEAKDKTLAAWRAEETQKRLTLQADAILRKLQAGEKLTAIAAAEKLELKHKVDVKRTGAEGLNEAQTVAIFNQPNAGAGVVSADGGKMIFQIVDDRTPAFDPKSDFARQMADQLKPQVADDILTQYVQKLQKDYGVHINEAAVRAAAGGASEP